jgi:hypothetical protein
MMRVSFERAECGAVPTVLENQGRWTPTGNEPLRFNQVVSRSSVNYESWYLMLVSSPV